MMGGVFFLLCFGSVVLMVFLVEFFLFFVLFLGGVRLF